MDRGTRHGRFGGWFIFWLGSMFTWMVRLFDFLGQICRFVPRHREDHPAQHLCPVGASLAWPVHDALVVEVADESVGDEAGRVLCDLLDDLTIPLRGEIETETNDDD